MEAIGQLKINRTRYAELGIIKIDSTTWRVADITDGEAHAVGPYYRTKFEAFADIDTLKSTAQQQSLANRRNDATATGERQHEIKFKPHRKWDRSLQHVRASR